MDTVNNNLKRSPIAAILLASVKTLGLSFVAFLCALAALRENDLFCSFCCRPCGKFEV
jgi:hypothetical protein